MRVHDPRGGAPCSHSARVHIWPAVVKSVPNAFSGIVPPAQSPCPTPARAITAAHQGRITAAQPFHGVVTIMRGSDHSFGVAVFSKGMGVAVRTMVPSAGTEGGWFWSRDVRDGMDGSVPLITYVGQVVEESNLTLTDPCRIAAAGARRTRHAPACVRCAQAAVPA